MRRPALFLLGALAAGATAPSISLDEYRARRAALRKLLPQDAVAVLPGATETEKGDLRHPFQQSANFLYLSGWRQPGAWMILAPEGETLLLPARNEVRERYTGRKLSAGDADAPTRTGFESLIAAEQVATALRDAAKQGRPIFTTDTAAVKALLGADHEYHSLEPKLASLRMIKSAAEIRLLQQSVDRTVEAHRAAWRRIREGLYEYQIGATMGGLYFEHGCEGHAYPPIVASGPNSVILHYNVNRRRMDAGELLLMDVGAQCADYTADITRTVPVNGRFTARQREVYEVVLGAQKAAIAAAKPGMKLTGTGPDSLNEIAKAHVRKHGLEKYYLHGLGHHVGLEVHDASDTGAPLAPGMVITIEPGIYIADEAIGVRIEDMILITETGCEVMSRALEREARDMERAVRRK